jgi:methylmalonyl-CoA/ethylmalonyl-CoA epimerase
MVKELRIALTVENYDEALAFYRDALGLVLLEEWSSPGANGALLEAGRATLEIFDEGQAKMVDALEVDDSAAVAEELERAGAKRLGGPVETPWGDVNVRLQAPDGMQLTVFTSPGT